MKVCHDVRKSLRSVLPLWMDWAGWLERERLQAGDPSIVLTASTWSVSPSGRLALLGSPAPSLVGALTKVWIHRGDRGAIYLVANRIETSAGQVEECAIRITMVV